MGDRFKCTGLPEGDVIVGEIREEVPKSLVCQYFGAKASKTGWKYSARTTVAEQEAILALYQRVYNSNNIPNKEISLQFARGLILMSLGKSVNWAQFAEERKKYRMALQAKKLQTAQHNGVTVEEGVAANLVKKRCLAPPEDFPTEVKLTVKDERDVEGLRVVGRNSVVKGRGVVSPGWGSREFERMNSVIKGSLEYKNELHASLENSTADLGLIQHKLRVSKMLRDDRSVILQESQLRFDRFKKGIDAVRADVLAATTALHSIEVSPFTKLHSVAALKGQVASGEAKITTLLFKVGCEEASIRMSHEVVSDCEKDISDLESRLERATWYNKDLVQRVSSLEGLQVSMASQLAAMKEGGGHAFFPQPLLGSPESPIVTTHALNACPICHLWYKCWDYVPLGCGHCYHPWCLAEHAKLSSQCCVYACKHVFLGSEHSIALGIRTLSKGNDIVKNLAGYLGKDTIEVVKGSSMKQKCVSSIDSDDNDDDAGLQIDVQNDVASGFICFKEKTVDNCATLMRTSGTKNKDLLSSKGESPASTKDTVSINDPSSPFDLFGRRRKGNGERNADTHLCHVCNLRPAAILLKECGHEEFCFLCIQGAVLCPICKQKISGWERSRMLSTGPSKTVSPLNIVASPLPTTQMMIRSTMMLNFQIPIQKRRRMGSKYGRQIITE